MDARHFDALARRLGSRRMAIGSLLAGLLLPLEASARGKNKGRKHKGRGKGKDQGKRRDQGKGKGKGKQRATAQADACWRAGACMPKKGANVSQCDLAGYTAPAGLNCTGCNLSRANLRGAKLQGANFTKANLSGACLIDADFTGATFANNTNLANALFCNTKMPDGSTNNSGCGNGTACCGTCTAAGQPCVTNDQCCDGGVCNAGSCCVRATCQSLGKDCGLWPNGCGLPVDCGTCTGTGEVCDNGQCVCTANTCASLGKTCGTWPDGCGDELQCGSCSNTQICDDGVCQTCTVCASGCAQTSLQPAINAASAGSTIFICPGTYATNATIDKNLTVVGAGAGTDPATGAILDGGLANRVLGVTSGAVVTLQDLTITRGGGTLVRDGAGIYNLGTLVVDGVDLVKNVARNDGGGIHNEGTLTVRGNSRLEENSAGSGGGGLSNYTTMTLENCRILKNTATNYGGGILSFKPSTVTPVTTVKNGVEISGNKAPQGGGIGNLAGTVTLETGSAVTQNEAIAPQQLGGGVANLNNGTVNVADTSIITSNTPNNCQPPGTVPNCTG